MPMKKGSLIMKYLEIKDGKGFFKNNSSEWQPIDSISNEDILYLLDELIDTNVQFDMDSPHEQSINHEAHKIIYTNIYSKLREIVDNKTRFIEESNGIYRDALEKYRQEYENLS